MSSHIGRTYLNSCLKVPIDPCNNCPAPVFNRPKIYLGNLSATPNTSNTAGICSETGTESKWSCIAIRSLAKLYESIPDYRDLKHLKSEDFYSTLNTLRSTCRALKVKTGCVNCEDRYNINTSFCSLKPSISNLEGNRNKTFENPKKKKQCSANKNRSKFNEFQQREIVAGFSRTGNQENINETAEVNAKSSKKCIDEEIECFKKSLQTLAAEFKRPLTSLNHKEYQPFTHSASKDFKTKKQDVNKKLNEQLPVINTFTSTLREGLRKSLSANDLHSLTEPTELTELRRKNKTLELLSFKGQCNAEKDPTKLSNYFADMSKPETGGGPKMTIDSSSASNGLQANSKSKQKYNKTKDYKMAFKLYDVDAGINNKITKHSTPSPIHPVARPNLAATLRAESSKKKLEELKNNCTFHNAPTQFDWEVRKNPAWKTLLLNESHEEILQLLLATRKAERALQKREYELNMELMRQRVKSAPLLLEGPIYCAPHVG